MKYKIVIFYKPNINIKLYRLVEPNNNRSTQIGKRVGVNFQPFSDCHIIWTVVGSYKGNQTAFLTPTSEIFPQKKPPKDLSAMKEMHIRTCTQKKSDLMETTYY